MIRACRGWATLAVLFAQALLPAAAVAETTAGVWSSGYQMGSFWAAVESPSGDSLSFSCSEGAPDTPYIRKGVSMRAEIAAIAEQGYRVGRTVDVALRTKSEVVALPMLVEGGGAMALADLAEVRADATRLIGALRSGGVVTLAFDKREVRFGLTGSSRALAGVEECAAAAR